MSRSTWRAGSVYVENKVGLDQFAIDTGLREIALEIDELPYNPIDE